MSRKVLVSVHGYAGDAPQIAALLPAFEHHGYPVIILSPEDSRIETMGPHSCIHSGGVGYTGQITWTRQWLHMKKLLEFDFEWYLLNDSDSFVVEPILPEYLFEDENVVWGNIVDDFRVPGEVREGHYAPPDYHKGYPLKANQPPYFMSRRAMEKIVALGDPTADPVTPFIDWYLMKAPLDAGLRVERFRTGVSFNTTDENSAHLMHGCVLEGHATFIHSVKSRRVFESLMEAYRIRKSR